MSDAERINQLLDNARRKSAENYRLLRLEFTKAAMNGLVAIYPAKDYDLVAKFAVQVAEATLAAAGEKS